ncbi:MAG: hypothetical protein WC869_05315 [Phycisphaerae bacterium]|jgi:hypothetical protein
MERRFVLLEHSGYGPLHYDLMLQDGEALATWQMQSNPLALARAAQAESAAKSPESGRGPLPCRRIADHRLTYLDYQGPVSRGRGAVAMLESGHYEMLGKTADRWRIRLAGREMIGVYEFQRAAGAVESTGKLDVAGDWVLLRADEP